MTSNTAKVILIFAFGGLLLFSAGFMLWVSDRGFISGFRARNESAILLTLGLFVMSVGLNLWKKR